MVVHDDQNRSPRGLASTMTSLYVTGPGGKRDGGRGVYRCERAVFRPFLPCANAAADSEIRADSRAHDAAFASTCPETSGQECQSSSSLKSFESRTALMLTVYSKIPASVPSISAPTALLAHACVPEACIHTNDSPAWRRTLVVLAVEMGSLSPAAHGQDLGHASSTANVYVPSSFLPCHRTVSANSVSTITRRDVTHARTLAPSSRDSLYLPFASPGRAFRSRIPRLRP